MYSKSEFYGQFTENGLDNLRYEIEIWAMTKNYDLDSYKINMHGINALKKRIVVLEESAAGYLVKTIVKPNSSCQGEAIILMRKN